MATHERHRGRLIDHIGLVVADFAASRRFYAAVLAALEIPIGGNGVEVQGRLTGRQHLAFQARNRAMVDAFYTAALAAGGTDNGPPGERNYHSGYYAAFVLDPDGNNVEAVFHGEAKRSAASVTVSF